MTLCLAGLNRTNVIVVGDRRLTVNGKPFCEDRTKLTLVDTRDARGVIAFSGLAQVGNFRTDLWLLETLLEAADPEYTLGATLERLGLKAAEAMNRLRLDANQRRVSFYFAGFTYPDGDSDDPRIAYCILSNFERVGEVLSSGSRDAFETTGRMEKPREDRTADDPAGVLIGGNHPVVLRTDVDEFLALLEKDAPAHALVGKAVDVILQTARSQEAANTIGEDLLTAVIPSNASLGAELSHRPPGATSSLTAANFAHLCGVGDTFLARDLMIAPETPGVKMMPKVGRNERCPCGSGKKFKRCHGA